MTNNKIKIVLLTTNKAGTLSAMMMKCKSFDLKFTGNKIEKVDNEHLLISMYFEGELTARKDELIANLLEHKNVIKVRKVEVENSDAQLNTSIPEQILEPETSESEVSVEAEAEVKDDEASSFEIAKHYYL